MSERHDIDSALRGWPYKPGAISARRVRAKDGREVIQMRVEMGLLQMETTGRPDGLRPHGSATYLDWLHNRSEREGESFILTDAQCMELDREFLQYYHRRVCWLALREFRHAVEDADHTLAMMDFALLHSPGNDWTLSHEQYREFVLFHRTQAAAMAELEHTGAGAAIEAINRGLDQMRALHETSELGEQEDGQSDESFADGEEQVAQLVQLKEWIRQEYQVGRTLQEQLADAVAAEEYERAAQLRDQIARRAAH
jgi:hypothetical protein